MCPGLQELLKTVANLLEKDSIPAAKSQLLHSTCTTYNLHVGLLTEITQNRFFKRWVKGRVTKRISLSVANHSQKLKVRKYVNLFLMGFPPFHAALPQKT